MTSKNNLIKISEDGISWVKSIYFWILVVVLIATNGLQLLLGYTDTQAFKQKIVLQTENHETRIGNLESGYLSNRDILLEIKFNLRNHMAAGGQEYIENISNNLLNGKKDIHNDTK